MFPHKKFVVYSQPRSGSSLLVDLLDSHSQIHCDREIINPGAGYFPRVSIRLARRWPVPFFSLRSVRSTKPVWGAKLLGYQVNNIRDTVQSLHRNGYVLVHLVRRDVLRAAMSDILARQTGVWHRREGRDVQLNSVNLDLEALAEQLGKRTLWAKTETTLMHGVESYRVVYEESLKQEDQSFERLTGLLDYLEVAIEPLTSSLKPTRTESLYQTVENLEQVVDFISRSDWAYLLDDFDPEPPEREAGMSVKPSTRL